MSDNLRLGFMASGEGTSLESLVGKIRNGSLEGFEPVCILSDRKKGEAGIWEVGERLNLPVVFERNSDSQLQYFLDHKVDLVFSMGYMSLVGSPLLSYFGNKMWNSHPSLLPEYGGKGMHGLHIYEAVLEAGEEWTGATVHVMNEEYDKGKILNQVKVKIFPSDDAQILKRRVMSYERELVEDTLRLYADGNLDID